MKDIVDLIGRVMLSFIFLYEAYDSLFYFKATKAKMLAYGLTWNPDLLLIGAIILLLLGGTMLLIGYRSGLGVLLLLLYWVPVTLIVHDFWTVPPECLYEVDCGFLKDGSLKDEYRRLQGIMFMKNLAIIGGLLIVWVNGSGRYSIRRLFATTKVPRKWK